MICAWIETSSAETGSSQTMKDGPEDERAGDADALALAARELVREAGQLAALQADVLERFGDAVAQLAAFGEAVQAEAACRRSAPRSCAG